MAADLTVRLGDILTMLGLCGGGLFVVFMMRADLRVFGQRILSVEARLDGFNDKLAGITEILVEQAKHDQRITHIELEVRAMRDRRP